MRVGHTLGLGPAKGRISAVTILVGIVMLLVPALAWMQYQWLGQVSTAERERMQRTLRNAAAQFATEFDSELSRTLMSLQVDGQVMRDENWAAYAQTYSKWASSAAEPRLVRDVWLVTAAKGTTLPNPLSVAPLTPIAPETLELRKWNDQALTFEASAWPEDLARLRNSLAPRFIGLQVQRPRPQEPGGRRGGDTSAYVSADNDDTLVAPVTLFELPDGGGAPKISILGFTIVRLEPSVVRDTVLASLAARHFHGNDNEADYRVAVVQRDDPGTVLWESEPGAARVVTASPDATQPFMSARPEQMIMFARNLRGQPPTPPPPPAVDQPAAKVEVHDNVVVQIERADRASGGRGRVITRTGQLPGFDGRWTLMAKHRAGSLEAAVAAARTRNLMVSFGVLLLLSVSIGLILVSARRAQELARQQMEFVAAVSHELRTPVSVIGAAAGNLADGVVGDPQRVRKYGETIQGEARRLGETVERVLQLAGIAAGKAAAARTTIRPSDLVDESLSGCRSEIEHAGVTVDVSIADPLPSVAGDATALRSAIQNLISNAVKYGGDAKWLRVSVRREREHVLFSVEDRGLGISAEDRAHIFEPFYRGREAVSQQIQGSGLGLYLVMRIAEAHGGRVTVTSEPGQGSTFTIALPAASADEQERPHAQTESFTLAGQATPPR